MKRQVFWIVLAIVTFVVAKVYDAPAHEWLVDHCRLAGVVKSQPLQHLMRAPGNITLVLLTIAALAILHRLHWRPAAILAAAVALAGGIVAVMKGVFGRARPDTWPGTPEWVFFRGGWHGFWNQQNVSFVSGDISQAFTWATVLAYFVPVLRWPAYAWALVTAFQRVAAGAHWPSDAVGGAVVGVVTARLLCRILLPVFPPVKDAPAETIERPMVPKMAEPLPMPDLDQPYVSLVIPCYNEQENVPTLLSRVEASMNLIEKPYEVIIVDDGSTDQTPQMLADAKKTSPWLRILRMQKNSGQSAAFMAGFAAARGKYIATIDADLQNDPEEVPRLVKMLDETPDVDMINGWRKDRQDTNFRRWQSRQANKIRNWISQDNINDSACSLKVHKSEVLKGVTLFNGAHRFFPAIAKMRGYRVLEVPVKHSHRFAGTAKYGFRNRAFRAFIDLLGIRWMKMRYLRYGADEIQTTA
ncbi:MAG: glycosyltransferase [Tepidisphaeraceae bacterium]